MAAGPRGHPALPAGRRSAPARSEDPASRPALIVARFSALIAAETRNARKARLLLSLRELPRGARVLRDDSGIQIARGLLRRSTPARALHRLGSRQERRALAPLRVAIS